MSKWVGIGLCLAGLVLGSPLALLFLLGGAGGAPAAGAALAVVPGDPAPGTHLPTGAVLSAAESATAGLILRTDAASATGTVLVEVATIDAGWTESRLTASAQGGTHSLGVYQERATQGWGTSTQELAPATATKMWLAHLPAGWQQMTAPQLDQSVERSKYPARYVTNEATATVLVTDATEGGVLTTALSAGGANVPPARWVPPPGTDPAAATAAAFAIAQIGKPYVWGGTGPTGYDCSGLVQAAWKAAGVAIPRTTYTQVAVGAPVPAIATLAPGDLIFIMGSDPMGTLPGHVGIDVGYGELVDAPYTGHPIEEIPVSDWAGNIVAMRHIA